MSEKVMRSWVVKHLATIDAVAVENPAGPGTPDVSTVLGWIELKHVAKAPARPTTVVAVPHYTPQQKLWARKRILRGGNCWLLLQVGTDHFLLDGLQATYLVGQVPLTELKQRTQYKWTKRPSPTHLLAALIALHRPWSHSSLRRVSPSVSKDGGSGGHSLMRPPTTT